MVFLPFNLAFQNLMYEQRIVQYILHLDLRLKLEYKYLSLMPTVLGIKFAVKFLTPWIFIWSSSARH